MSRLHVLSARLLQRVCAPRRPLAGAALCAAAGIVLADRWTASPWWPLAGFLLIAGAWLRWRRVWLCWVAVGIGFGAMHVFRQANVPATALAQRLGNGNRAVRAIGTVVDEPRARAGAPNARFTLALEHVELDGEAFPGGARVAVSWPLTGLGKTPPPAVPAWGDRVELIGAARNLRGPRNPGEEDFASLGRRRGVLSEVLVGLNAGGTARMSLPAGGPGARLHRAARGLRAWMSARLALDLREDVEVASVVHSMILGLSPGAPGADEVNGVERGELGTALQETGTLHFFAVDGLKVGLLIAVAIFALRLGGMRRDVAGALAVPALVFYAFATGLGPASLRATIMAGAISLGLLRDRPTWAANNLGLAALAIFATDSNQLFSRGFQLSFAVVAVILVSEPFLRGRLLKVGAADPFIPRKLWPAWRRCGGEWLRLYALGLTGLSLAAWLGSLPLMLYWFHLVSPVSVVANVVAFPLALVILALGVMALGAALVSNAWAVLVNNANWFFAKGLIAWVRFVSLVPGGHVYVGPPEGWPRPLAELTVFDLGRGGSAMHLRADGRDWLLDAGRPFDYEGIVRPALRARGVNRLDGLLLRQDDLAHAGAAKLTLTDFSPTRLFEPPGAAVVRSATAREWRSAAGVRTTVRAGDVLPVAPGVELRVLAPGDGSPNKTSDDRGLVLVLQAAGSPARILLTGNAGRDAERWLLARAPSADAVAADVLVLGTHVHGDTGSPEFLRAVAPRLVVVQTDPERSGVPGHATPPLTDAELATALPGERLPQTLRTERDGAVTLRLWPDRVEARGFVGGRMVTLPARVGGFPGGNGPPPR